MMAMANFSDLRKIDAVVTSIRLSFGADGNDRRLLQVAEEEAFTRDSDQTDTIKPSVARLRDAFSEHISDAYIDMSETETEVRIRLDGRVFFRRGSAELHPMAYAILADVGKVLAKERVYVRVEGFADTVGNELNNWELSLIHI